MTQSLSSPFPIFTDVDGDPLESGYIYVGTAGLNAETNQIPAYWDSALTIPAAQPIRTVNGYPSRNGVAAVVYMAATDFSLVIKNKNGSLVFSALNKTQVVQVNSSTVLFLQVGTGAIERTALSKMLDQPISVFDFMTLAQIADVQAGTLTLDVRDAILAACNAAYAAPAGTGRRKVFFPNGKYRVNSTIGIGAISLEGEAMNASVIYYHGINACFTCTTGGNTIKNLTLDGTNANAGSSVGIAYDGTLRHTLSNCYIRSFFRGITMTGVMYGCKFTENFFAANSIHVYSVTTVAGQFPTTNYFSENEFLSAFGTYAIYLQDCEGFTFERNVLQGNGSLYTIFIYYFSALTNAYANHVIKNNWFEENGNSQVGSADIYVFGSFGIVSGVMILENQFYTAVGNNPTYCIKAQGTSKLINRDNTWNLGSPWIFSFKTGSNTDWVSDNPRLGTAVQQLTAEFEEGPFTPTQGAGLAVVGAFSSTGHYTKVGNTIHAWGTLTGATSVSWASGAQIFAGLPYNSQGIAQVGNSVNNAYTASARIVTLPTTKLCYSVEAMAATPTVTFDVTYYTTKA